MTTTESVWAQRFNEYFSRPVAERASASLANHVEVEFKITDSGGELLETFVFTREGGQNRVLSKSATDPDLVFTLTPSAAQKIIESTATEIGPIGVEIARLIVSPDANRRVSVKIKTGFFTLFSKGYLGVVTAGGKEFAQHLHTLGLTGPMALKALIKKLSGKN